MPEDGLTLSETSALLILMAEAREVRNAYLTNECKLELKKASRDKLRDARLINVRQENRQFLLELSEKGWQRCEQELAAGVPPRAGAGGAALYAVLAGLKRCLDHSALSLNTVFGRFDDTVLVPGPAPSSQADLESQIRKAYQELASRPGSWVRLVELRTLLGGATRPEVDHALTELSRSPDITIVPESDQKLLTEQDRASAVRIGNQDKHLIAIGQS